MSQTVEELYYEMVERGVDLFDLQSDISKINDAYDLYAFCAAVTEGSISLDEERQEDLANKLMLIINELRFRDISLDNCINEKSKATVGRPKISKNRINEIAREVLSNGGSRNAAYKKIGEKYNRSPTTLRTQYLKAEKERFANYGKKLP